MDTDKGSEFHADSYPALKNDPLSALTLTQKDVEKPPD